MHVEPPFGPVEFQQLTRATDNQMCDLKAYLALLIQWNGRMNLVGPSAIENFWLRHAWDSAQLLSFAPAANVWADVGSGAGLPGVVLAILLKENIGAHVHLIESMAKRCRFLSELVERLSLSATVHNSRAEDANFSRIEVVTARACAPMAKLLSYCHPLMKQNAFGLFLKGQTARAEIEAAKTLWTFKDTIFPSRSDPSGAIVRIEELARV